MAESIKLKHVKELLKLTCFTWLVFLVHLTILTPTTLMASQVFLLSQSIS